MKKIIILLFAFVIFISGCTTINSTKYTEIRSYSDGMSWFKDDSYYCCVDETGKMIFKYSMDGINRPTDFENGYSFLPNDVDPKLVSVIDKAGNKMHTFSNCLAYGYGIAVVESHQSNFNSSEYKYDLYNPDGTIADSFSVKDSTKGLAVYYLDEGVFWFENYGMYFAKSSLWVNDYKDVDQIFMFNKNGKAFFEYKSYPYQGSYTSTYVYADSNGEFTPLPKETTDRLQGIQLGYDLFGDTVYFYSYDGRLNSKRVLTSYDVSTKRINVLKDESIINHLNDKVCSSNAVGDEYTLNCSINQNGIIISLIGDDSLEYITLLDSEFNTIIPTTQKTGEYIAMENGNFFINNNIYDKNGKIVYSADYNNIIADSKTIEVVRDSNKQSCKNGDVFIDDKLNRHGFYAVNQKGDIIFEGVDKSSTEIKKIS